MAKDLISVLPAEVLLHVIGDITLTNKDRKNVRLACRQLEPYASIIVFRRLFVSRFRVDRDAFLGAALNPRLAEHVREIVWYELGCDGRAFRNVGLDDLDDSTDDDNQTFSPQMADELAYLCWVPAPGRFAVATDGEAPTYPIHHDEMTWRAYNEIIQQFQALFIDCMNAMPKLDTLISAPMPSNRTIPAGSGAHPLEVEDMKAYAAMVPPSPSQLQMARAAEIPAVYADHGQTEGLTNFLLPAMRALPGKVKTLRWMEDPDAFAQTYLLTRVRHCLSQLTHLDLSINYSCAEPGFESSDTIDALDTCLRSIPSLQSLRLAFDCHPESLHRGEYARLPATFLRDHNTGTTHTWRALRSLSLTNVKAPQAWLVPLLRAHANTLNELHIIQCSKVVDLLKSMVKVDELRLDVMSMSWNDKAIKDIPGDVISRNECGFLKHLFEAEHDVLMFFAKSSSEVSTIFSVVKEHVEASEETAS